LHHDLLRGLFVLPFVEFDFSASESLWAAGYRLDWLGVYDGAFWSSMQAVCSLGITDYMNGVIKG